jgi:hypothetical protein
MSLRLYYDHFTMSSLPRLLGYPFLFFFLTMLPLNAFSIFLIFYFCKSLLQTIVFSHPLDQQDRPIISHTSNLFRSSLCLLILPYLLSRVAFLLQASSSSLIDFSNRIPYQNAAVAFALECVFLCPQWIGEFHVRFQLGLGILIGIVSFHFDEIQS